MARITASGAARPIHAGVALHLDASQLHLADEVGNDAAELGPGGEELGQQNLATELGTGFVEGDLMAALGGDGGGLHARRATAHDHHALGARGGPAGAEFELAPGLGVLDAGDGVAGEEMADAGLVAADTGADVVDPARARLVRHLGVADHGPGHAADVGLAPLENLLGDLGLVDAAGDDDGPVHPRPHGSAEGGGVAGLVDHGRDNVCRAQQRGGGAGDDAVVVQRPLLCEGGAGLQHLVLAEALVAALLGRDAQAHDEAVADAGADAARRLAQEPEAVFGAAAIGVLALVDARVEELGRQVAVAGHDLDTVGPRLLHARRGGDVARDHRLDQVEGHGPGHDVEALVGARRGSVGDGRAAVEGLDDLTAGVEELGEEGGAMAVQHLRQAAVIGDAVVRIDRDRVAHEDAARVHARHLGDDEPGPAPGAGLMISEEGVAEPAPVHERRLVPRGEDAVLQRDPADGEG